MAKLKKRARDKLALAVVNAGAELKMLLVALAVIDDWATAHRTLEQTQAFKMWIRCGAPRHQRVAAVAALELPPELADEFEGAFARFAKRPLGIKTLAVGHWDRKSKCDAASALQIGP